MSIYDGLIFPDPVDDDGGADAWSFERAVHQEIQRMRVREAARKAFTRENQPPAPPFDAGSLREMLTRPAPPAFRVDRLMPANGSLLVNARRKAGKTTLVLNLARSLITGEPFLGDLDVIPLTGNVGFLNYEVSGHQLARWAAEHRIDRDRLQLVNLRGRRNPLDHEDDRAALAAWLRSRDVEALVVDPFGRAYCGASQNDAAEVGAWLVRLDQFTRADVGARDLILSAHAGWNGDRTRGSSAIEDWPDVVVTLAWDEDDEEHARYIKALGRDVDLEEDRLDFDPRTRTLTLSGGGSRKATRDDRNLSAMKTAVLLYVKENPGCSGNEIEDKVKGRKGTATAARKALVADRVLLEEPRLGQGGGKAYRVRDLTSGEVAPTSPNLPPGHVQNLPHLPLRGEVLRGEVPDRTCPRPNHQEQAS